MHELKDEDLIRELRRAELAEHLTGTSTPLAPEKIFAQLIERHQKPFVRLITLRYPVDSASAEEITQDFWLECYSALPRYNPDRPFLSWATTILFRTAERFLKKRRREVQLSPQSDFFDLQISTTEDPELASLDKSQIDTMLKALRKLPPELSVLIDLRFFEKKKIEEIMAATGLARSTVFEKLNLAYKKIRALMENART
ncbi:MAG: sigma-70 family RNA polymerase sigma factor [Leptospiraceae bacterium]|nr:sigma-70 family RNA polymerase sigma factor [Leptospiraceae bacterium]